MKRADFIKLWSEIVDQGRLKNFPDMRLSERACSRMDDDKKAGQMWLKHRIHWAKMTREEVIAILTPKGPS
jgi:hypothetical protein